MSRKAKKVFPELVLIGKKLGMTQIFSESGDVLPVTALKVGPCVVVQKKTQDKDGYNALQLGFDDKKAQNVIKAEAGHAKLSKSPAKRVLKEFRVDEAKISEVDVGHVLDASLLKVGDKIDATGTSIGKGFQGVMKRHNFRGARHSHNHEFFRHGGSIGMRSIPGRVFKNKKMPGHMGDVQVSVLNLSIVAVDTETNVVLVKGAVPGAKNSYLTLKASVKGGFEKRPLKKAAAEAPAAEANLKPVSSSKLGILYEDEDLVVVDKPPFVPSHVTLDPSRPHLQGMLERQIGHKLTLFHRLDVDTTGVVLFGKNPDINKAMSELFLNRKIRKFYWVVVRGRWLENWREVRTYIRKTRGTWANFSKGKASERAVTHFKVIKVAAERSWLEAELQTGKTHQIRLHCLEMGHPVLGDRVYGAAHSLGVPLALHAVRVEFEHPRTKKSLKIEAPLPDYWEEHWLDSSWV